MGVSLLCVDGLRVFGAGEVSPLRDPESIDEREDCGLVPKRPSSGNMLDLRIFVAAPCRLRTGLAAGSRMASRRVREGKVADEAMVRTQQEWGRDARVSNNESARVGGCEEWRPKKQARVAA